MKSKRQKFGLVEYKSRPRRNIYKPQVFFKQNTGGFPKQNPKP